MLPSSVQASYTYNADGCRTKKTVGGVTTEYWLDGGQIVSQKSGDERIWYYYDSNGTRLAMEYGGQMYYYYYNVQGDVLGLFDDTLNVVVEYTYDSWENILSATGSKAATVGKANPFRYRGYYDDEESGLYYLQSHYYDPATGRFLNADGVLGANQDPLSYNLFAYCSNNPINFRDPSGESVWDEGLLLGIGIGIGVGLYVAGYKETSTLFIGAINALNSIILSKKRTNRPDSGLAGIPDEEISRRARDKSLPGSERNRYREEEKVRGLRNKQKRESQKKALRDNPFELPELKNELPDINGNYNDPNDSNTIPGFPCPSGLPVIPVFP